MKTKYMAMYINNILIKYYIYILNVLYISNEDNIWLYKHQNVNYKSKRH